jgi:hypothetical protein
MPRPTKPGHFAFDNKYFVTGQPPPMITPGPVKLRLTEINDLVWWALVSVKFT